MSLDPDGFTPADPLQAPEVRTYRLCQPERRFTFLSRQDPGWVRAWGVIRERYGSTTCDDAGTGEVWQYMGTVIIGEGGRHQFRHRHLPAVQQRTYHDVEVLPGDFAPREVAP